MVNYMWPLKTNSNKPFTYEMRTDDPYLKKGPIEPSRVAKTIGYYCKEITIGACSVFLGQVRADQVNGKTVRRIEYSAYEKMVAKEMGKIKKEILLRFSDVKKIHVLHGTGSIKAGEISLFVMVVSGHREQAFKASKEIVDLIKEKLPIWKKEVYEDESFEWKEK